MHDKTLDTLIGVVGIALVFGAVSMVSQSNVKVAVSKPYSQAQGVAGAVSGNVLYDVNYDRRVDNRDVQYVARYMGGASGQALTYGQLDYNDDARIDSLDKDALVRAIGGVCPARKVCDLDGVEGTLGTDITLFINYIGALSGGRGQVDYNNDRVVNHRDGSFFNELILQDNPCPSGKFCDLNRNGRFDVGDFIVLTKYLGADSVVDFNNDKRIDLADLGAIRSYIFNTRGDGLIYFDLNLDGKIDNKDVKDLIATKNSRVYNPLFDIVKRDSSRRLVAGSDGLVDGGDLLFMRTNLPVRLYYDLDISGITSIRDVQLLMKKMGAQDEYLDVIGSDGKVTIQDIKGIGRALLDLNRDGKVNFDDIYASCTEEKNCDFNEDGKMNEYDNSALKEFLTGAYSQYIDSK